MSSNSPASNTTTVASGGTWPTGMRSSANQAAIATTASSSSSPFGFTTAEQADSIVTFCNEVRTSLIAAGIIKGSA